jgi:hypothetical protein
MDTISVILETSLLKALGVSTPMVQLMNLCPREIKWFSLGFTTAIIRVGTQF